ncbi:DinB family protein [Flavobacteriaceae bacterium D16]|nr:DinB family protein [Flavobacteriaceae bacterium D16]
MRSTELRSDEFHEFYKPYIDILGDVELLEMLSRQLVNFPQFLASIPEEKLQYAYAPGKWSIAQVLVHILDSERVFQYRALRFARNDQTPLPGFDQDDYISYSGADSVSKELLIQQYQAVRQSTIALFASLDKEALMRKGQASGVEMSVRALGFFCCGHQKHHRNIIRERYL